MDKKLTTIELFKEDMKFSAGHYTIFSPTHREKLHGHNFTVYAAITASVDNNGMAFDYDIYKERLRGLCRGLSEFFLIAGASEYQRIEEDGDCIYVYFHDEKIPFLKRDVLILPLKNITVEELSGWFVEELSRDKGELERYNIQNITVKVYSAPGQCAGAQWRC
jgi:6-pyruvoyltetrahydropterin/6-carboxytetrahydropterin synthase